MTSIRKSIAAAVVGLAMAGALGFGASELYASAAGEQTQECPSVCPLEQKASASSCPMESSSTCPMEKSACPTSGKGA